MRHLRKTAAALTAAAALTVPLALAAPAHASEVQIDDAQGDVQVTGTLSDAAYNAADLSGTSYFYNEGGRVYFDLGVERDEPGAGVETAYRFTMKVTTKATKKAKKPKPYTVVATATPNDPESPFAFTTSRSGTVEPLACDDATFGIDSGFGATIYVSFPQSCLGKGAKTVRSSVLTTVTDGGTGRDGLAFTPMAL